MIIKNSSKIFMVSVLIVLFSNGLSATCLQTIPGAKPKTTINISTYLEALNSRFNKTDIGKKCGNGKPLYMCTGVLVHTIDNIGTSNQYAPPASSVCPATNVPANVGWCPSSNEAKLGRVSFSYLRKDIMPTTGQIIYNYDSKIGPSGHKQEPGAGYILNLSNSMKSNLSEESRFSLLCSYPADGATFSRSNYGCYPPLGKAYYSAPYKPNNYFDNCGNNPVRFGEQSSIDADHFDYFISVAKLTNYLDLPHNVTNNEFVISSWVGSNYNAIPLQVFYYVTDDDDMGDGVSKNVAYTETNLYYKATGIYVPVVAIDMRALRKAKSTDVSPFVCPEPPPKV